MKQHKELTLAIIEALGLTGKGVRDITYQHNLGSVPTVTATFVIVQPVGLGVDRVRTVTKCFELVEKPFPAKPEIQT